MAGNHPKRQDRARHLLPRQRRRNVLIPLAHAVRDRLSCAQTQTPDGRALLDATLADRLQEDAGWKGALLRPFCVGEVAERGLASRTSGPLSAVPQVAQDAAAACHRSLRPRRAGPSLPRTEGPCGSWCPRQKGLSLWRTVRRGKAVPPSRCESRPAKGRSSRRGLARNIQGLGILKPSDAKRAAVGQALSHLARSGRLMRICRSAYMRPV